ncbi:hypothetical protein [Streptomyces sp. NBC_01455]|uniref:hypothetical protein n=1 Tax=Streptomyces sp. NBC_01455 TaxID=2903874 RepID=UPI002E3384BD|nr:hypothetical protein [Streptomyces sp. NBC_01455]
MTAATEQVNETGAITYRGPVAGVHVHAHMEFGPYALTVPLDSKVVIQLMFMLAEQTRQGPDAGPLRVTPQTVLERLRELGVVSGNGSRLVGRDAVYDSFTRLQEKGYIRRIEPRNERGQRTGIAYEFYDWPSWNPDAPKWSESPDSPVFPQVNSTSGIAGSGIAGSGVTQMASNESSPQVRTTSGIAGSGDAGSGKAAPASPQVRTTSGNAGSPPHPPEEVTTSSPYPLTNPAGLTGLPSPREEGEGADSSTEDLRVAADVLELLPDPWTQGRLNAGRLAPKLLEAMAAQGWPTIHAVDRTLLMRQLTKNPRNISNPYRLLASDRIPNLPRYAVVAAEAETARPPGATSDGMCPKHPNYRAGNRCIPCITA